MSTASQPQRWFPFRRPQARASLRVVCFPHAGGGAATFNSWAARMPPHIELCAVDAPGRGSRWGDKRIDSATALIDALLPALRPLMDVPLALFGHSLGALVAFELARRLRQLKLPGPAHLIVSGSPAPRVRPIPRPLSALPDESFREEVRKLGGSPPEVLAHREMMELLTPVLRNDFAMFESYRYTPEPPLGCPLTAWGGRDDPSTPEPALEAWREETQQAFSAKVFPGGHFFLFQEGPRYADELIRALSGAAQGT